MRSIDKLESPLNTDERYLHGINVRLEVLIDMFSSFLEVYAKQNEIATTNNKIEIEPKVEEEVIEEVEVIIPKKRRTKK